MSQLRGSLSSYRICAVLLCSALVGCETGSSGQAAGSSASARQSAPVVSNAPTAAPSAQGAAAERFGAGVDESTAFVSLADLQKSPDAWDGKRVRTRGEVVAVCQAAGCWADIRPEGDAKAVVPAHLTMHHHAFFLPKTLKTRVVDVDGTVTVRALGQSEVDHYNGEGASLVAGTRMVTLDALGVAVR